MMAKCSAISYGRLYLIFYLACAFVKSGFAVVN